MAMRLTIPSLHTLGDASSRIGVPPFFRCALLCETVELIRQGAFVLALWLAFRKETDDARER